MALANERRMLGQGGPKLTLVSREPASSRTPLHQAEGGSAAVSPLGVKTALSARDLNEREPSAGPVPAILSEAQIRALKDDIYRSLLEKVRSDFERGA